MASHHQPETTPFGQPLDYERRSVRPIPAEQIARIMGECTEDYDEQECVEEVSHLSPSVREALWLIAGLGAAAWAVVLIFVNA